MHNDQSDKCGGSCPSCPMSSGKAPDPSDEGLAGWVAAHQLASSDKTISGFNLVIRAIFAFFIPPLAALIGAWAVEGSETKKFLGLLAGLVIGVLIAKLGSFFVGRPNANKHQRA